MTKPKPKPKAETSRSTAKYEIVVSHTSVWSVYRIWNGQRTMLGVSQADNQDEAEKEARDLVRGDKLKRKKAHQAWEEKERNTRRITIEDGEDE
jgi:hypothetical protein